MELRVGNRRSGGMRHLTALLPVVLLLAACAADSSPTPIGSDAVPGPTDPELASGVATQGDLTLSVMAMPAVAQTNEVIGVTAQIANAGSEPLTVSGPGSGVVFFSVTRLEDGLSSGPPVMEDDCTPHEFRPDQPVTFPFKKSGAFTDEDRDADFRRSYFADPELRLPAGVWRVDVTTAGVIGDQCRGESLDLEISLLVTVTE